MTAFGNGPFGQQRRPYAMDYEAGAGSPAVAAFFNAVYAWMCVGLALTAVIAWFVSTRPDVMRHVFSTGTFIFLLLAELALVFTISAAIQRINTTVATGLFLLYAALNGLTLSFLFIVYTGGSLAGAFIACSVMFGVMSVFGMVTKADLSGLGKILFMGLIGLIVASVVNLFLQSNFMSWILSYVGVAIFVGLTAYDTQKLRQTALATVNDPAQASKQSVLGALILYLDFLNLFLFLVQILGQRKNN